MEESDRELLFRLSLDLLCIAGFDGYFKQVNPSWTRVMGWSEEELLARPIVEFMHPDDRARTLAAREQLAHGVPLAALENRYLCKDGSYRWLSWKSSASPEAGTVFAVARDITGQRRADQEKLISSKLESAGTLVGGIAHDFNNLLASVLLNVEMIDLVGTLNPQQLRHLQDALATLQGACDLTRRLISFTQSEISEGKAVQLGPLLRHALNLALAGRTSRGECRIAADLWPATVDARQITQLIQNLAANACEAMGRGGRVQLVAENFVATEGGEGGLAAGNYIRISVIDEGAGIAEEALPRIFDPYFSTKPRGTAKGMGLGLTICHTIVQNHRGVITVESEPGKGTRVDCFLPARAGKV